MYVAIEGIDTSGKSTQLELLQKKYPDAVYTKEPGGTKLGLELREMVLAARAKSPIAEMFLFLADRAEHTEEVIKANADKIIISDRSLISGIAYAHNLPHEILIPFNIMATSNILPTHTILLDLSKEELEYRLSQKVNDGIESRGVEYLLNIQNRMKRIIKALDINHIIVSASLSIKEIEDRIEEFLNE